MTKCKQCGEEIVFTSRHVRKFCSEACRKDFHKQQSLSKRKVRKKKVQEDDVEEGFTTIDDPIAYIRKHHGGIIDFDAGMLLTFGFPKGWDNKPKTSFRPVMIEYSTNNL